MPDMQWTSEGTRIFDKLMGVVPDAMREMIKPKLLELLATKAAGKPVTGEVIARMIQEDLPEPQKSIIIRTLGIKKQAKKKAAKKESPPAPVTPVVAKKDWEGNSQSMFERVIQEVPASLRHVFRAKFMDILKQKAQGGPFKAGQVMEIVRKTVPEPFKSTIFKAFATMGGIDIDKVEKIIETFPGGQETLISLLHNLQYQFGYIPEEALRIVSEKKGIFMSVLYRLVTSYQAFRTEPPRRYLVTVCSGTACYLKGGGVILKRLEENIPENGSEITLEEVRCLGCCDLSPVVIVNGEVYGGTDAQDRISEILGE